jgi:leucyl-tRNA synthetase
MLESFVLLLAPFAPHVAEELWSRLGHAGSLALEPWPAHDPAKIISSTVEIVIQVNGKVRSKMAVALGTDDATLEKEALSDDAVRRNLEGKQVVRVIVIKNKLVNIVVR